MSEKNPIQVSDRIFRTIELLARSGPSGLLDISNELELNKSTVHRILNSLICMDYVKQDPDTSKYSLTFKICSLSNQVLSHNSLIDIARPYIQDLAEQTGETVHLVQMEGINAVYIDKVEAPHNSVRMVSMVGKQSLFTVPVSVRQFLLIWMMTRSVRFGNRANYTLIQPIPLLTTIPF